MAGVAFGGVMFRPNNQPWTPVEPGMQVCDIESIRNAEGSYSAQPQKMMKSREHILEILYRQLRTLSVDERVKLTPELAAETTVESLRLDSLDTLVLAMGLEDALNMPIGVEDLPKNRTLSEVADLILRAKH